MWSPNPNPKPKPKPNPNPNPNPKVDFSHSQPCFEPDYVKVKVRMLTVAFPWHAVSNKNRTA